MPVKPFGEFVASTHPVPSVNADHILGAVLVTDNQGRPEWVDVQFQTADGEYPFQQVRMEFLNAMFLFSCLRAIQLETGFKMPDDPRA